MNVGTCPLCGEELKLYVREKGLKKPITEQGLIRIYCSNTNCKMRHYLGELDGEGYCIRIWAGKKKLVFIWDEDKRDWQKVRIIRNSV